jgi:L-asparagine oxygenase
VRHDVAAPRTRVSDSRAALALLDKEDVATLYGNHFIIQLPYRWRGLFFGDREHTDACALLYGPRALPRVNAALYRGMMVPTNTRAEIALRNFHEAIRTVAHAVDITPGTFIYVDNRFALHSRDAFSATFDENGRANRWVQRVYVASSLWNFRAFACRGNRIFDPTSIASDVPSFDGHEACAA